jgi:hypothetical protein
MKATKAYIASLGTTGMLLASSLALLLVVSAIVAFNGWPGSTLADRIGSLAANGPEAAAPLSGPARVAADALPAAAGIAPAPATVPTPVLPGGADPSASGGAPDSDLGAGGRTDGGGGSVDIGDGGDDDIPGPQPPGVVHGVADKTEGSSRTLGDDLGRVNADGGSVVGDTGESLSHVVRDVPDVNLPEVSLPRVDVPALPR